MLCQCDSRLGASRATLSLHCSISAMASSMSLCHLLGVSWIGVTPKSKYQTFATDSSSKKKGSVSGCR